MRIDMRVRCNLLGLSPPPVRVHLKWIFRSPPTITLLVWTERPNRTEILAWLQPLDPVPLSGNNSSLPNVMWVHVGSPPEAWTRLLRPLRIDGLVVDTDGMASLRVEGPGDDVRSLQDFFDQPAQTQRVAPLRDGPKLTPRQEDALVLAVSQGYYSVPRRSSQKDIAQLLGISNASCSELLRRAEAAVVADYVKRHMRPPEPL